MIYIMFKCNYYDYFISLVAQLVPVVLVDPAVQEVMSLAVVELGLLLRTIVFHTNKC